MKKFAIIAIVALFTFVAQAQSKIQEADLIQSVYGMQKRDLIAKHMKLTKNQATLFWQMYSEYEIARKELGARRVRNIENYADKYNSLSDIEADALMKTTFEVNAEFIKLWEKTYKTMAKSISSGAAAQFIQAEMFFENIIRQQLAMEIPLIGEFEVQE